MNAGTLSGSARVIVAALVIAAAVALGLLVGNAIGERDGARTNFGYPPGWQGGAAAPVARTTFGYPAGWQGGAAAPVARTADASFSLEAIEQLNAIRANDVVAAARSAGDASDYALRHPSQSSSDGPLHHEGLRKRAPVAAVGDDEVTQLSPTPR